MEYARAAFNTNYFGMVHMAKAVVPHMAARRRGLVINVGSIVGDVPTPFVGHYCASKAALQSITEVLRMECKPLGVKVMLLLPGAVKSNVSLFRFVHKGWLALNCKPFSFPFFS